MKFIVLLVLSSAIAIEAYPFIDVILGGIGKIVQEVSSGVGSIVGVGIGTGVNVGVKVFDNLKAKVVAAGVGAVDQASKALTGLGDGLGSGLRTGLTFNSVDKEPKNVNPSGAGKQDASLKENIERKTTCPGSNSETCISANPQWSSVADQAPYPSPEWERRPMPSSGTFTGCYSTKPREHRSDEKMNDDDEE